MVVAPVRPPSSSSSSPTHSSPDHLPRSLSCQLVSPTSSFNSSPEVPLDVRSDVVHSPVHEKEVSPPQPDAATPPSDFSDSYPSALIDPDPTNIIHHSDAIEISTSPHGSFNLLNTEEQATPPSNFSAPSPSEVSGKARGPLFTDPSPPTPGVLQKQGQFLVTNFLCDFTTIGLSQGLAFATSFVAWHFPSTCCCYPSGEVS